MHSIVLAAASDYFHCIFSNCDSNHDKNVHLESIDSKTMQTILNFCYTGQVELNPDNIESISIAACELKMLQLKSACSQFIKKTANAANCLQYALIAEKCEFGSTKELAYKFFTDNCANLCQSKDMNEKNTVHINDIAQNLCENSCEAFEHVMKSMKIPNDEENSLLRDAYLAIYKSFVSVFTFKYLNI